MPGQNGNSERNKVVISGISGRFPNSNNITELQNNLLNKVDCTTTEHKRWVIGKYNSDYIFINQKSTLFTLLWKPVSGEKVFNSQEVPSSISDRINY